MTTRIGKVLLLEDEPSSVCDLCGNNEELRPYGPNGENVCFDCAMKDEAAAKRAFYSRLEGDEPGEAAN